MPFAKHASSVALCWFGHRGRETMDHQDVADASAVLGRCGIQRLSYLQPVLAALL